MKIPATRPNWTKGEYVLWKTDAREANQMVGYFRQFKSAHTWREYLRATTDAHTFYITHRGITVNIWHRENQGSVGNI